MLSPQPDKAKCGARVPLLKKESQNIRLYKDTTQRESEKWRFGWWKYKILNQRTKNWKGVKVIEIMKWEDYSDGGELSNQPIECFRENEFESEKKNFKD